MPQDPKKQKDEKPKPKGPRPNLDPLDYIERSLGGVPQPAQEHEGLPIKASMSPIEELERADRAKAEGMRGAEENAYAEAAAAEDFDRQMEELDRGKADRFAQEEAGRMRKAAMPNASFRVPDGQAQKPQEGQFGRVFDNQDITELPPQGPPSPPPEPPGELELELQRLRKQAQTDRPTGLLDALAVIGTGLSGVGAERTMNVADRLHGGPEKRTASDRALRLSEALQRQKGQSQGLQSRLESQERVAGSRLASQEGIQEANRASREGIAKAGRESKEGMYSEGWQNRFDLEGGKEQGRMDRLMQSGAIRSQLQRERPEKGPSISDLRGVQDEGSKDVDRQIGSLDEAISRVQSDPMSGANPVGAAQKLKALLAQRNRLAILRENARSVASNRFNKTGEVGSALQDPDFRKQYEQTINEMMTALDAIIKPEQR